MKLFLINPVIKKLFWIRSVLNLTDVEDELDENKIGTNISL